MSDMAGVPFAGASRFHSHSLVDGRQLVAGRAIVGWTVRQMAEKAGVNRTTVCRVEAERTLPRCAHAADKMAAALEANGILFEIGENGPGVRFTAPTTRTGRRYRKRDAES